MSVDLIYYHNSDDAKVWLADLKDNIIIVKFGKKDSPLREIIMTLKTSDEAKKEFDKRVKEKLNKGYKFFNVNDKEKKIIKYISIKKHKIIKYVIIKKKNLINNIK